MRGKVHASCPFAMWNHGGGVDRHPSFVVWDSDKESSSFYCSGCKVRGASMQALVWKFQARSGRDMTDLMNFVREHEQTLDPSERIKNLKYDSRIAKPTREQERRIQRKKNLPPPKPIPESVYEPYRKIPRYLVEERGITEETCRIWDLGDDPDMKRALFPMRNMEGQLMGIAGRFYADRCRCGLLFDSWNGASRCPNPNCCREIPPKYLNSDGIRKDLVLYGEHLIDKNIKRCYVVEGYLDAIRLWQMGYRNVVAIMGSDMSDVQANRLVDLFEELILIPDGDGPGRDFAVQVKKAINNRVPLIIKEPPWGSDPGELTEEETWELLGKPD